MISTAIVDQVSAAKVTIGALKVALVATHLKINIESIVAATTNALKQQVGSSRTDRKVDRLALAKLRALPRSYSLPETQS